MKRTALLLPFLLTATYTWCFEGALFHAPRSSARRSTTETLEARSPRRMKRWPILLASAYRSHRGNPSRRSPRLDERASSDSTPEPVKPRAQT